MTTHNNGCRIVELGSVLSLIRNGLSIKQSKLTDGLPITRIETISNGEVDVTRVGYAGITTAEYGQWLLASGDILLSHINSEEHLGKVALYDGLPRDLIHGMNLLNLRADPTSVLPQYLLWVLRSNLFRRQVRRVANRSVNQASVSITALSKLEIPCPPLPEQRRIADILDKADGIRRKQEKGIWFTEELLRSTFLEMFGDPAMNPKGWPIHVMGEVVKDTQYGTAEKSNSAGTGIPVLRMNNITYGGDIDLSNIKWSKIKETDFDQLTVKRGDLLFNRTNSPELVGKTAVWDRDEPYAYAGYLFRVRFDEKVAMPDYISAFLNSAYGKKMLFAKAKPSNNMSNLSAGEFCRIELPVPEIALQRRFSKTIAQTKHLKAKQVTGWKETESLFGSLVQRAFQGEL